MSTFAIENGYAEGIVRGFRSSFFSEQQYTQIKNCSTLDELKSVLYSLPSSSKTQIMVLTFYLTIPTFPSHSCAQN